jgi:hypothetical protein
MRSITSKVAVVLVALSSLAAAAAAETRNIVVTISAVNGRATAVVTGIDAGTTDLAGADVNLEIRCDGGFDCLPVTVKPDFIVLSGTNPKTATIEARSISSSGTTIRVRVSGSEIKRFELRNSGSGTNPGTESVTRGPCTLHLDQTYDRHGNVAHFVVTPGGSILQVPDQPVDENDIVIVHVVGDNDIVDNIEVARTSATRSTVAAAFVGQDVTNIAFQAREETPKCIQRQFTLGDFAPGEATVEMYTIAAGQKTTLGSFKFNVNRLWDGIFSFGPVWTRQLSDETFTLAPRGDKKIIVASEEGTRNILYAVQFTYFAWGRRDLQKPVERWYERVNPSLGIAVKKMSDHAMAGLSVDLGMFLVSGGTHFSHVTRLSRASSLVEGGEFAGEAKDIPTSKRWQSHAFVSVSIDLRAAGALLKTLTGGGK